MEHLLSDGKEALVAKSHHHSANLAVKNGMFYDMLKHHSVNIMSPEDEWVLMRCSASGINWEVNAVEKMETEKTRDHRVDFMWFFDSNIQQGQHGMDQMLLQMGPLTEQWECVYGSKTFWTLGVIFQWMYLTGVVQCSR